MQINIGAEGYKPRRIRRTGAARGCCVAICDELWNQTGRSVKLGVVHAVLSRLEEKGLVKSQLGEATKTRGGKRKRFNQLTIPGKTALVRARSMRDQVWDRIPSLAWKKV